MDGDAQKLPFSGDAVQFHRPQITGVLLVLEYWTQLRRILGSSGRAARVPAPEISVGCNAWMFDDAVAACSTNVLLDYSRSCTSVGRLILRYWLYLSVNRTAVTEAARFAIV